MKRILQALLLILAAERIRAQRVKVQFMDSSIVEKRLRESPRKNRTREEVLRRHFEEAGCRAEALLEQPVRGSKVPNLICTLRGEFDKVIIVGAHFDFIGSGEGIIDNWSGSSLLPILYEGMKSGVTRHRFVFASFTDEEKGLVGSSFYVRQLGNEELGKISAMINMDSLGTSTTKVELARGDKGLLNALSISANSLKVPISPMDVHKVGLSDSDSFQNKHVPTIDLHSLTQQTFGYLHSPEDRVGHIDFGAYYDSYRLMVV